MVDKFSERTPDDELRELAHLARGAVSAPRADGALTALTLYVPQGDGSAPPLALLSHGVGGDQSAFRYLGDALRDAGWLVVVMGHWESGRTVLRQHISSSGLRAGLLEVTTSTEAHRARQLDIGAALAWVEGHCRVSYRVLLGHSMGAATTMIEAGAQNLVGIVGGDRFDAYVAMSPQGPGSIFPAHAWTGIHKPLLIVTGTRDNALEGDWQSRTVPYADLPPGNKWLAVIDGATHISFSGLGFRFRVRALTARTVCAFVEALRRGRTPIPPQVKRLSIRHK